jgi:galactitol-specific phosphotransferase system IIB component
MGTEMNFQMQDACKRMGKFFSGAAMAALLAICGAGAGCSKEAAPKVASHSKVFDSASPEIKVDWEKVVTASSSNDYATAILTCRKLQAQGALTPEQSTAVSDTMTAMNNQMTAAAQKGDQNATKAIEEVRKNWRTR